MNRPSTTLTFPLVLCTWILAGMSSMSAFAHPLGTDFSTATDLGATTSWTDGRTDTAARLTEEIGVNFFRFRVSSRMPVQMWTAGAVDTRANLYDSDEVWITENDDGGPGQNFGIEQELDPGIYYIRVHRHGGSFGSYRLHLDTETGDDDHSDSFEGATRVSLPGKTEGRIDDMDRNPVCCPDDTDWFQIQVAVAGTVQMWTTGAVDTRANLYDSDEVWITENDDGGPGRNFRIEQGLDPGIYYIRVHRHGGSIGPYTLHLDSDTGAGIIAMFPAASRFNLQGV